MRANVGGVTLFSDDIEALARLLSNRFGAVHIETERFERVSGEEFFKTRVESRPRGMMLTDSPNGWSANIRLSLGRHGAEITADDAREAETLFLEIKQYLRARQSWIARYWSSSAAQWVAIPLVGAAATAAVWLYAPERWWAGILGSVVFVPMLNAFVGMMALSERHARAVIIMNKTSKEASFRQRNRDVMLVVLAGAFALAAAALQVYLAK